MIKVYDNVFSEKEITEIENTFTKMPWYLSTADEYRTVSKNIYDQYNDGNTIESVQLTDFIFSNGKPNSPVYPQAAFILEQFCIRKQIPISKLIRIKANLQVQQQRQENQYNTMHVDGYEAHLVLIYYVNDSDGHTIIFDSDKQIKERIVPKRGRCLLFSGNQLHSGQPPLTNKTRVVINYNFL